MSESNTVNCSDSSDMETDWRNLALQAVLTFLQAVFPPTFARRIVITVLLAAGINLSDIPKLVGVSKSTVYNCLNKLKIAYTSGRQG